jgi:hypothetical protein
MPLLAVSAWWTFTRPVVRHATQFPPATEETLQQAIADLTTIHQMLPSISSFYLIIPSGNTPLEREPASTSATPPLFQMLRILAFTYPPYLILTLTGLIRIRTLAAIAGTVVILHRAPFALVIRRALWRSAYFRWSVYWTWAKISGNPLPGSIRPFQSDSILSASASEGGAKSPGSNAEPKAPANIIRFLFTVYENQRWWMGLDYTAALLPGERPSWCSRSLQPCSPPAAFSLPPPTTVYVPEAAVQDSKSAKGKVPAVRKRVMKRMAVWSWEEPEWKVVVHKEGTNGNMRVERPLPSLVEEGASASAGRILRAAGKIRGASVDFGASPETKLKEPDARDGKNGAGAREGEKGGDRETVGSSQGDEEEEPFTDADGWIYGDNKWESRSTKGGLGKVSILLPSCIFRTESSLYQYTRYRRWTRVAVLNETVEWIDEADVPTEVKAARRLSGVPILQSPVDAQPNTSSTASSKTDTVTSPVRKSTQDSIGSVTSHASSEHPIQQHSGTQDEGSRLRQRLKAVVNGVAH